MVLLYATSAEPKTKYTFMCKDEAPAKCQLFSGIDGHLWVNFQTSLLPLPFYNSLGSQHFGGCSHRSQYEDQQAEIFRWAWEGTVHCNARQGKEMKIRWLTWFYLFLIFFPPGEEFCSGKFLSKSWWAGLKTSHVIGTSQWTPDTKKKPIHFVPSGLSKLCEYWLQAVILWK